MNKQRFLNGLFLLGATTGLILPALINGYPLVYADTSTYLASGFTMQPPFDRPMTYGLFVRLFSLNGLSLWPVIAVQSLLLSWLIFQITRELMPAKQNKDFSSFVIVLILSLFAGVSWVSSQIMPDIFTSIMVLSALLILTRQNSKSRQVFLYVVFFFSCAMHVSHLAIGFTLLAGILIIRQIKLPDLKRIIKIRPVVVLSLLVLLSIITMGSALSKSKHVFFMGALVEHGIAKKYLDRNCKETQYALCAYKDSLPPLAWQFIWEESSPFYKVGGWKGTKAEFNEIIRGTLTSPRFMGMHVAESLKATFRQLTKFDVGDGAGAFPAGTLLHERIVKYLPQEQESYENSLQNREKLIFKREYNIIQRIVILISIVMLIVLPVANKEWNPDKLFIMGILILWAVVVNAWVCGTFAGAIDRLGSKMIWFIPWLAILFLLQKLRKTALPER
ncbi:MAG: hypothetical protein V2B15_07955 [Bacteroidota bacterium]